jgi:hypothetical protein
MTTFTTEDRILAEKDGSLTVNVNAGEVTVVNKDLTDEEILKIWRENERVYPMEINRLLERSRAIIKKALEK